MGFWATLYIVLGLAHGALMEWILTLLAQDDDEETKMQAEIMLNSPVDHGLALTSFILLWPMWIITSVIAGVKGLDN